MPVKKNVLNIRAALNAGAKGGFALAVRNAYGIPGKSPRFNVVAGREDPARVMCVGALLAAPVARGRS
ncbi:MAG: hypothetical protein ACRD18_16580, partial [Terriglobia bacterium]